MDQVGVCRQLGQASFQVPHVGRDIVGDQVDDLVSHGHLLSCQSQLLLEDGCPSFVVGRLDVHNQALVESALEPVRKILEFLDMAVQGEDHLAL